MFKSRPRERECLRWFGGLGICIVLLMCAGSASARADGLSGQSEPLQNMVTAAPSAVQINRTLEQRTGYAENEVTGKSVCSQPANPGEVRCAAQVLVTRSGRKIIHLAPGPRQRAEPTSSSVQPALLPPKSDSLIQPKPWTPGYLQEAYDLSWLSANRGTGDTVAIVDVGYDATAASDLATFRNQNGLSSCPSSGVDPCFRQVNEAGSSDVSQMPGAADAGWQSEITLDIDAVSSICPNCNLLLVDANSAWGIDDLATAEQTAATLGADQISNSWSDSTTQPPGGTFTFPGVLTVAAGGDSGFDPSSVDGNVNEYPAAYPGVLAAGGTTLAPSAQVATGRGFGESVWNQTTNYTNPMATSSGCDTFEAKPSYQTDVGCPGRAWNDLAADADPLTGLEIYDGGQWQLYGGTSLSSPLIAAYAALIGEHTDSPAWTYNDAADMYDVTTGDDADASDCASPILYICNAGLGYDGPTGNGTMSGTVVTGGPGIGGPGYSNGYSYVASRSGTSISVAAGIYPNGLPTSYHWNSSGGSTAPVNIGSGPGVVTISANLPMPVGNEDDFQLVVSNADGTVYGYDQSVGISGGTVTDAPANTLAPQLDGAAVIDQTLTTSPGWWSPAAGAFAYQWQVSTDDSSWTDITGATGPSYQIPAGELGDYLRAQVTATDNAGSTTATSAVTTPVKTLLPRLTGAPAVSGTALNGRTLTANPGQWDPTPNEGYAYQWQRSADASTWTNISGATAADYTLKNADVADVVRVRVIAFTNNGAGQPANSAATQTISSAPANTSLPTVQGTAQRPDTLTAGPGQWLFDAAPVYHYQWQRSADAITWSNIVNATSSTYTVAVADEGDQVRVQVTDTNTTGTTVAVSAATATVANNPPIPPANPTISGSVAIGQPLTIANAAFTPADVIVTEQWQRSADASSWTDISGATNATYTPTSADIGFQLRVEIDGSNADGRDVADSSPVSIPGLPVNFDLPQISVTPQAGALLVASQGTWNVPDDSISQQWVRCPAGNSTVNSSCQNVGSGGTYTPSDGDVSDRIAIVETATDSSGATTVDSALSAVVTARPPAPSDQTLPAISGVATRGSTLVGSPGIWTNAGISFTYAWQQCSQTCQPIGSAAQLTVTKSMEGSQIKLVVIAFGNGASTRATSALTDTVTPSPPVAAATPQIQGSAQIGDVLQTSGAQWDTTPDNTALQWYVCNGAGDGCSAVAGQTGYTFDPSDADAGDDIVVAQTATNVDGSVVSTSAPLGPVTSGVPPRPPPRPASVSVSGSTAKATVTIAKAGRKPVKTSAGERYATAKLTAVKHTTKRKLMITRAPGITGSVTSWACQTTGKKRCLSKKTFRRSASWTTALTGALRISVTLPR